MSHQTKPGTFKAHIYIYESHPRGCVELAQTGAGSAPHGGPHLVAVHAIALRRAAWIILEGESLRSHVDVAETNPVRRDSAVEVVRKWQVSAMKFTV